MEEVGDGTFIFQTQKPFDAVKLRHFLEDLVPKEEHGEARVLQVQAEDTQASFCGRCPASQGEGQHLAAPSAAQSSEHVLQACAADAGGSEAEKASRLLVAAARASAAAAACASAAADLLLKPGLVGPGPLPSSTLACPYGRVLGARACILGGTAEGGWEVWDVTSSGILVTRASPPLPAALPAHPSSLEDARQQEVRLYGVGLPLARLAEGLQACLLLPGRPPPLPSPALPPPAFSAYPTSHQLPLDHSKSATNSPDANADRAEEGETVGEEGRTGGEEGDNPASMACEWVAGRVGLVGGGAPQLAAAFRDMEGEREGRAPPACHLLHWRASWIEPCRAASLAFERLAGRYPGVAFWEVDVTASPANRKLALEKVMTPSESARRGALPVLRAGAKFPCYSAQVGASQQPARLFTGSTALSELESYLANLGSADGAESPGDRMPHLQDEEEVDEAGPRRLQADTPGGCPAQADSGEEVLGGTGGLSEGVGRRGGLPASAGTARQRAEREGPAEPASSLGTLPGRQGLELGNRVEAAVSAEEGAAGVPQLRILLEGASQLKQELGRAGEKGGALLLLWTEEGSPDCQQARALLLQAGRADPRLTLLEARPSASRSNHILASGLAVRSLPTIHLYQGMKLHKKLAGSKICGLAAALEALPCPSLPGNALDPNADIGSRGSPGGQTAGSLQSPRMSAGGAGDVPTAHSRLAGTRLGAQVPAVTAPTHISVAPTPAADEGATGESEPGRSGTASTVPQGSPSVERASGGAHKSRTLQKAAAAPRPPESAVYDPPSKAPAGKDVTRKFPSGLAHFWPKMPCLQCGCPWWLGEDWDARCVRCAWSCEKDGYDDDSQPLPAFRKKWKHYTTLIQSGVTAPYEP